MAQKDPPPPKYESNKDAYATSAPTNYSYGFDGINGPNDDDTDNLFAAEGFSNPVTRKRFMAKVLTIVGAQLMLTFGFMSMTSIMVRDSETGKVTQASINASGLGWLYSRGMLWTSMIGSFALLIGAMCCCQGMLRKVPINFIFLFVWTLMESHFVSIVGFTYNIQTLGMVMAITAGIVLMVGAIAWFAPVDFTKMYSYMIGILFAWILISLIGRMFMGYGWGGILYSCIGVTIFMIFLAIDLQMIMGGKKHEISEDDYVFAAINIYLDILNIFLYLLQMFGGDN